MQSFETTSPIELPKILHCEDISCLIHLSALSFSLKHLAGSLAQRKCSVNMVGQTEKVIMQKLYLCLTSSYTELRETQSIVPEVTEPRTDSLESLSPGPTLNGVIPCGFFGDRTSGLNVALACDSSLSTGVLRSHL